MKFFRLDYGPGVDSDSNSNKLTGIFSRGKGGRCVGLTTLPTSRADCIEIREPQTPGTLRACPGLIDVPLTVYVMLCWQTYCVCYALLADLLCM